MALIAVVGETKSVNHALMAYALNHTPHLIVDCANVANIHKWFARFPDADYEQVFVYEFELLHKFRDSLLTGEDILKTFGVQGIVVTSMGHLFHYQNQGENMEVYAHAWELLASLGKLTDVRVAVDSPLQRKFARRAGASEITTQDTSMGHIIWSQRQNLERMVAEMEGYAKSLRPEERVLAKDLLRIPFRHVGSLQAANSLHAWSFLLFSIMLEQEKRLRIVEQRAGTDYIREKHEKQEQLVDVPA